MSGKSPFSTHVDEVDGSWVEAPSFSDDKSRYCCQLAELGDVTSWSQLAPEFAPVGNIILALKGAASPLRRVLIENTIAKARLPEQPHLNNAKDRALPPRNKLILQKNASKREIDWSARQRK